LDDKSGKRHRPGTSRSLIAPSRRPLAHTSARLDRHRQELVQTKEVLAALVELVQLSRPSLDVIGRHALSARDERADEADQVMTVGILVADGIELRDDTLCAQLEAGAAQLRTERARQVGMRTVILERRKHARHALAIGRMPEDRAPVR